MNGQYVTCYQTTPDGVKRGYTGHIKKRQGDCLQIEGNGANGYFIVWFREAYNFYTGEKIESKGG